ncbi:lipopolysaccharide biosynthesis protein [Vibrio vulnificus]|uniref:lipopolysaccharide biosynthesis protein n=1 Tax=Vibrio vulnificus TaxID=672 RepID=UPI001CDC4AD8|nr:oligosaccharide flippase family protein [Vibrio vulnificus]
MNRSFTHYIISELIIKGALFIALPLLTYFLSVDSYGRLSIINSVFTILFVFASLNLHTAISNSVMRGVEDIYSCFKSVILFLIPYHLIFISFSIIISFKYGYFNILETILIVISCVFFSYVNTYLSILIAKKESVKYSFIFSVSKLLEIALMFGFVFLSSHLKLDASLSKITAQLLVFFLVLLCILFNEAHRISKVVKADFNVESLKDALLFGVPLIIHVVSNALLAQSDRFFIDYYMSLREVGIYSFSYNIGMIILVPIMAWQSSWQPRFFHHVKQNDVDEIRNVTTIMLEVITIVTIAVIAFSDVATYILGDKDYYESILYIPMLIASNAMIHFYLIYSNYSFYLKRSVMISGLTLCSVIVNCVLNSIFIPKFGLFAAVVSTYMSYVSLFILHYLFSLRNEHELKVSVFDFSFTIPYIFLITLFAIFVTAFNFTDLDVTYNLLIKLIVSSFLLRRVFVLRKRLMNQ